MQTVVSKIGYMLDIEIPAGSGYLFRRLSAIFVHKMTLNKRGERQPNKRGERHVVMLSLDFFRVSLLRLC
jgi:hypothetical protein